jgi:hypothetical protein
MRRCSAGLQYDSSVVSSGTVTVVVAPTGSATRVNALSMRSSGVMAGRNSWRTNTSTLSLAGSGPWLVMLTVTFSTAPAGAAAGVTVTAPYCRLE